MVVLTLPRLVSGREIASDMVTALGDIRDFEVVVDARATSAGTGSFAAQIVRDILVVKFAKQLTIVGAPTDFRGDIEKAAIDLSVRDRVELSQTMPTAA